MEMTSKILWYYGMEWHGNLFHIALFFVGWIHLLIPFKKRHKCRHFMIYFILDWTSCWTNSRGTGDFETPWRSCHLNVCCITEIIIMFGKYRRPNSVYLSLSWKSIAALLIMRVIEDNHVACSLKKKLDERTMSVCRSWHVRQIMTN